MQMQDKLFLEKYHRLEQAVNFKPVDRLPYCDWVQNPEVIQHYSYKSGKKNYWNEEQAQLFAKNAMDMNQEHTPAFTPDTYFPTPQDLYGIFDYEKASKSMKLLENRGESWTIQDSDGYIWEYNFWTRWILERPFDDYDGAINMLKKKIEELNYFSQNVDWELYGAKYQQELQTNIEKSSTPTLYLTPFGGIGFDIMYLLIGWEYLSDILYCDDIKILKEYINSCVNLALKWIEHAVHKKFSPVALIYSDIAYKGGLMISPKILEDLLGEGIYRLTNAYHKKGIKVIYHSEGNIQKFIDVLIKNGVDGINPLEPYSDMEIIETRKRYPDLILYGGVDEGDKLLPRGTPEDVEAYVKKVIREIGKESGILLGSSGEVHPACKLENVIAMIETIKNTPV